MFEVFLQRAEQLSDARKLVEDEPLYAAALALLSVHAAMALNDALLTKFNGRATKGDDHMAAVAETIKRCRARRMDESGVQHLRKLVSAKSAVSYGDAAVSFAYAGVLSQACERFETWAYRLIKEIA